MSEKPPGSPPPYESEDEYNAVPQPAYSYYPDDEFQHFYRWSSPPGVMKIMTVLAIILCVGIFACVASTLAWDTTGGVAGFSGSYGSYGNYGPYGNSGTSFGGGFGSGPYSGFGYGVLGSQNDPRQAKGFMIFMAIFVFAALLVIFILMISHQRWAHSRKFYLAVIISSAILALFMFVATIVYLVAVNPMAQTSGSVLYNQIWALCSQYQDPQAASIMMNQYLYHYCVVDPQEAVAIVFGFLVTFCLVIVMVFAIKTRQKINRFGKDNIVWRREKLVEDPNSPQDVEDWVNNVSAVPEFSEYPEKFGGSQNYVDDHSTSYDKPPDSNSLVGDHHEIPLQSSAPYYSSSEATSSVSQPKKKHAKHPRRADAYHKDDADYASSGDELDDEDFTSDFPPIAHVEERESYKRDFDMDHQEYKSLQAELDEINKRLAEVDQELDELQEGTPQFLDAMDEYNALRDKKKSGDYQGKKKRCKYLKAKLNHIKRMVSDYDNSA
ncbi:occludin [Electrophorus electricus]|uniref:occludin n=1 Tax=Electrophorus electricus TaxID=8005 RepID=UPI0015CF8622|nr:occludin [Electrophorus electricus]